MNFFHLSILLEDIFEITVTGLFLEGPKCEIGELEATWGGRATGEGKRGIIMDNAEE